MKWACSPGNVVAVWYPRFQIRTPFTVVAQVNAAEGTAPEPDASFIKFDNVPELD